MGSHRQRDTEQAGDAASHVRQQQIRLRTKNAGNSRTSTAAVLLVFGLAALMIFKGYDPTVIVALVAATSIAASEMVNRIMRATSNPDERTKIR